MFENETIYLDYQASTPLHNQVRDCMAPFLTYSFANPHSNDHVLGWKSNQEIQKSRNKIANAINSDSDEIIFTSGATEANNFLIKGIAEHIQKRNKTKIITSPIEHKCVLSCFEFLGKRGFDIIYIEPNTDGIVDVGKLREIISDEVGLVSVMLVNNEIGTVQPIAELAAIAHKHDALFHTDAAQAPVFMPINSINLKADMISFSSHKIYGPKGIGAAFVRRETKEKLTPLIHGGEQEDGLRSGTLPTALCVGFGEAFSILSKNQKENEKKLNNLSTLFLSELMEKIPNIEINGSREYRHPGNLNIRFPGIKAQDFLQTMQPYIAASTGSACNSGIEAPSYVLDAIGLSEDAAAESIRFSFGIDQSEIEVIEASEKIFHTHQKMIPMNMSV